MKKLVITLALTTMAVGAFAQGKLTLAAPQHPVRYSALPSDLKPGDAALAGQFVTPGTMNITFMYNLGPNAAAGTLMPYVYATTPTINSAVGLLPGTAMVLNTANGQPASVAGNAKATFQVLLWDNSYASYAAAFGHGYTASSGIHNVTAGSIAGSALDSATASDWLVASQWTVAVVPEPATASLIGLGLASLLIFRRRK